eukprot:11467802-Alexandrium_andersonii.AAC.1
MNHPFGYIYAVSLLCMLNLGAGAGALLAPVCSTWATINRGALWNSKRASACVRNPGSALRVPLFRNA